jgi:DNA-binding Lrp family transcriptional regulator
LRLGEITIVAKEICHKMAKELVRAMLCINTQSCSKEVAGNLMLLPGVSRAYPAVGAYDVIAEVQGESLSQLRQEIIPSIRRAHKVKSTLTLTLTNYNP